MQTKRVMQIAGFAALGAILAAPALAQGAKNPPPAPPSTWTQTITKEKGVEGMKRRPLGRPRQLSQAQCAQLSKVLLEGALAQGFATELWTLPRVAKLIRERFGNLAVRRGSALPEARGTEESAENMSEEAPGRRRRNSGRSSPPTRFEPR